MKKIVFLRNKVKDYYNNQYSNDLQHYFKFESRKGRNYILSVDRRNDCLNGLRLPGSPSGFRLLENGSTDKNFIFAGFFSYMILTQQALFKVIDETAQEYFHQCTGWPKIYAGMAGPNYELSKMLVEAELFPVDAEKDNYLRMLDTVFEFMNDELSDFLLGNNTSNINQQSYQLLIDKVKGNVDAIILDILEGKKKLIAILCEQQ